MSTSQSLLSSLDMSEIEQIKVFVIQRLTAAAEEIIGVFAKVVEDREENDSRSKREIERQNRLLDIFLKPEKNLQRTDPPQLSVCKEEVPPDQQERSPSLDQEDPEPPLIKEEQEETWTSQEREQLQWLEETDTKDSIYTVTSVRSLYDKHQSWSPHLNQTVENREGEPLPSTSTEHMETEADGEGYGVSEPTSDCQSISSDRSVAESENTDRNDDRSEGPQSDLKTKTPQTVKKHSSSISSKGKESTESSHLTSANQDAATCKVCLKSFTSNASFMKHVKTHTQEKPCICGVCGKYVESPDGLMNHLETHKKAYYCSICHQGFRSSSNKAVHMRIHSGEKPYNCSFCGKRFSQGGNLKIHMRIHTGEKPYTCSFCGKGFHHIGNMKSHMKIHTGEQPYTCNL